MFQVRTSYLPTEILWGYKFEHSCVEYNPKLATYDVSFDSLNTMIRDNTPWYKLIFLKWIWFFHFIFSQHESQVLFWSTAPVWGCEGSFFVQHSHRWLSVLAEDNIRKTKTQKQDQQADRFSTQLITAREISSSLPLSVSISILARSGNMLVKLKARFWCVEWCVTEFWMQCLEWIMCR